MPSLYYYYYYLYSQACEDYLEPPLEELLNQLKAIDVSTHDWFRDHLISDLSSLTSADDLFNFFEKVQSMNKQELSY